MYQKIFHCLIILFLIFLHACGTSTNVGNPNDDEQENQSKKSTDSSTPSKSESLYDRQVGYSEQVEQEVRSAYTETGPDLQFASKSVSYSSSAGSAATGDTAVGGSDTEKGGVTYSVLISQATLSLYKILFVQKGKVVMQTMEESESLIIDWVDRDISPALQLKRLKGEPYFKELRLSPGSNNQKPLRLKMKFVLFGDDGEKINGEMDYLSSLSIIKQLSSQVETNLSLFLVDSDLDSWFEGIDYSGIDYNSDGTVSLTNNTNSEIANKVYLNFIDSIEFNKGD